MDLDVPDSYFWIRILAETMMHIFPTAPTFTSQGTTEIAGSETNFTGDRYGTLILSYRNVLEYDEKRLKKKGFDTYEGTWFNQMLQDPVTTAKR